MRSLSPSSSREKRALYFESEGGGEVYVGTLCQSRRKREVNKTAKETRSTRAPKRGEVWRLFPSRASCFSKRARARARVCVCACDVCLGAATLWRGALWRACGRRRAGCCVSVSRRRCSAWAYPPSNDRNRRNSTHEKEEQRSRRRCPSDDRELRADRNRLSSFRHTLECSAKYIGRLVCVPKRGTSLAQKKKREKTHTSSLPLDAGDGRVDEGVVVHSHDLPPARRAAMCLSFFVTKVVYGPNWTIDSSNDEARVLRLSTTRSIVTKPRHQSQQRSKPTELEIAAGRATRRASPTRSRVASASARP